jgi:hypothetical protein
VSPGSHAAGDGSFARSAGIQTGRAALLIAVAVLIGVLLLHRSPAPGGSGASISTGGGTTTPTITETTAVAGPGATTGTSTRTNTPTTAANLRAPQDIKVIVANGTTTAGLAARVSNLIHGKGYNTLASTNATVKPPSTIIYFAPSYSADAAALASKLNLPASAVQAMATPPPVANLNGANILVVIGPDLASAGSTTSST